MAEFYRMHTELYPMDHFDTDQPYVDIKAVPADACPLDRATDLFFSLFLGRVKATERQATDIQIVKDGLSPEEGITPCIVRAVARLGGQWAIRAYLYADDGTTDIPELVPELVTDIPDDVPVFRKLDTIDDVSDWDIIDHGPAYPSPRDQYERRAEGFLKGEYAHETRGSYTTL